MLRGELEVEHVEVLRDAFWPHRLGERGASFLQMPAQHHIGGVVPSASAIGGNDDRPDGCTD